MGPRVLWAHHRGRCASFFATRLPSIRSLSLPWSPAPSIVDPDGLQSALASAHCRAFCYRPGYFITGLRQAPNSPGPRNLGSLQHPLRIGL